MTQLTRFISGLLLALAFAGRTTAQEFEFRLIDAAGEPVDWLKQEIKYQYASGRFSPGFKAGVPRLEYFGGILGKLSTPASFPKVCCGASWGDWRIGANCRGLPIIMNSWATPAISMTSANTVF